MFNYIRNKYHPIFWLFQFSLFRSLYKLKFLHFIKRKKFGNFFIYLPRHLAFFLNINNIEKETFNFVQTLNIERKLENTSFVDIGGNIGLYSLYFKNNYNSKIYIFEPDEDNFILLFKTKKINEFNNFIIFPLALSNKQEIKKFLKDDISGSTGTLSLKKNVPQIRMGLNKETDVYCDKLDSFMNVIKKVSWIKIDIEGYEVEALEGMMELIKRDQPNLIIESNEINIIKISEMISPFNYKIKKIDTDPNYVFYK